MYGGELLPDSSKQSDVRVVSDPLRREQIDAGILPFKLFSSKVTAPIRNKEQTCEFV